jgi:hypothetical protein
MARETQKTIYRSMQGKEVDINKLININEMTPAVGNIRVNARGDELGSGGKIIRKREEILAAAVPPNAVPDQINVRPVESTDTPAPAKVSKAKNIAEQDPEGNE